MSRPGDELDAVQVLDHLVRRAVAVGASDIHVEPKRDSVRVRYRIDGWLPLMGRVMRGIVSDLATNPALGAAFREQVVALRLAEVRRLVARGVARGDLRPGADHHAAAKRRVPLARLAREPAQGDAVVDQHVVADLGRLADHHPHAVVDEEPPPQPGAG